MVRAWKSRRDVGFGLAACIGLLVVLGAAAPAAAAIAAVTYGSVTGSTGCNQVNLTTSTGTGNTVVVIASIKNTSAILPAASQITDSGGSLYWQRVDIKNGTNSWVSIYTTEVGQSVDSTWVKYCLNGSTSDMVVSVASYSGVVSFGQTVTGTPTSATPSISVTLSEANNWVVAGFAAAGSVDPAAGSSGTRETHAVANGTIGGALVDNTNATAGTSVANAVSLSSSEAVAIAALELRVIATPYEWDAIGWNGSATVTSCTAFLHRTPRVGETIVMVIANNPGTAAVSQVQDNATLSLSSSYTQRATTNNGSARIDIWTATAISTATTNVKATVASSKPQCIASIYANVSGIGQTFTAIGSTANPTITPSWSIGAANNVVVAGFSGVGLTQPTAGTGWLRATSYCVSSCGSSSANTAGALTDNTSTTATTVTNSVTLAATTWAAAAIELKWAPYKWSATTSATTMAPPGLDPWSNAVITGSNDNKLYGFTDTTGASRFTPFANATGPIQSRPALVPASYRRPTTTVNIAYFGSQDTHVYAVDTTTGNPVWQSPALFGAVQGGPAIWLQAVDPLAICGVSTADVVIVGTNGANATGNKVYALNASASNVTTTVSGGGCVAINTTVVPGGIIWQTSSSMDIVSSTPYVDYTNNVVWVTSRSNVNTQASVWKLNIQNGSVIASWTKDQNNVNLGDIDTAPNGSADGTRIYVGTNGGKINAFLATATGTNPANSVVTYTPASTAPCNCTGAGTVKMPWWLSFAAISQTPDTVIFSRNATVHSVSFNGTTFTANWTVTPTGSPTSVSGPVDDGANHLYIGASDGQVHQLAVSNGADQMQRSVNSSGVQLGEPTFDIDNSVVYVGGTDGNVYTFAVPLQ